ncbi:hypothetical protein MMC34_008583 [Xylographa carneopallida]|nr:hypothetical protein [Xylographa carneopallida]
MSGSDSSDPCLAAGPGGSYDQPLNVAACFIILLASLLGCLAPLFFQRHPRYLRYPFAIILGKHVGTGVLLALALIHLLGPAVQELTDPCLPYAWSAGYSYSPLFAMLSALLMHLIETSVLEYTVYSKQADGGASHAHAHLHGHGGHTHGHGHVQAELATALQLTELRPASTTPPDGETKDFDDAASKLEEGSGGTADGGEECAEGAHTVGEAAHSYAADPVAMKRAYQFAYDQHTKVGVIHRSSSAVPDSPLASPARYSSSFTATPTAAAATTPHAAPYSALPLFSPAAPTPSKATSGGSSSNVLAALEQAGHSHGVLLDGSAERTIGAYILEAGLTSHSIIVGITLGVASHSDLISLIPALTFHQFFEGFALGARLASCRFSLLNEGVLAVVYSLSAPVGIAIGIGVASSYQPSSTRALITQGTFDSVSAGILLYVAFVQMMASEFAEDYRRCGRDWAKKCSLYAAMWTGAAVMAVIGKWL